MKLLLTSLIVFCSSSLHAGNYSVKDSIRLDEVVVTGTRSEVNLRHLPMSVSTINKKQIEQRYEPSLLPLLSEAIPGMFVTGRGIMGYGVA
ncbi:MAG: TonB-dependent receptor, partial [Bacteroides sp.]